MGLCPKPHFIFWLDPKNEAKKLKAADASHEKLAFEWLNPRAIARSRGLMFVLF